MSEDVAKKYIREAEEREARVKGHLEEADDLFAQADKMIEGGMNPKNELLIVHLQVRGLRAQTKALLVSFQVGEKPEDEPES